MHDDATQDRMLAVPPQPRDPPGGLPREDGPPREPAADEAPEVPPGYGPDPDYAPASVEPEPTPALPEPPQGDA
ncbi:MAG: hypothetical protein U1E62_08515 [Alsobacter sp.]